MNCAYFGHHKCASTWLTYITFEICNVLGFHPVYKKMAFEEHPEAFFRKHRNNFLISITSTYSNVDQLEDFRGFHVVRDPRDICVSGYFSHLYSHRLDGFDRLIEHRKKLKQVDKEDGLYYEFDFTDFWLQHMNTWNYDDERILEIKMEELTASPYESLIQICKFMNILSERPIKEKSLQEYLYRAKAQINRGIKYTQIPNMIRLNKEGITKNHIQYLSDKYSFSNLSEGRSQGEENIQSHYRKGVQGDWKNHFSKGHKQYFKQKYGDLLIKLGYEKDLNW